VVGIVQLALVFRIFCCKVLNLVDVFSIEDILQLEISLILFILSVVLCLELRIYSNVLSLKCRDINLTSTLEPLKLLLCTVQFVLIAIQLRSHCSEAFKAVIHHFNLHVHISELLLILMIT